MLKIKTYNIETMDDNKLMFAVIAARYRSKWIFVRHKDRSTWEIAGGHREEMENIEDTASRELFEETGAKDFKLYPISIYSVEKDDILTYGQLYYAEVESLGELPDLEIGEVKLFDDIPQHLTYPLIQPFLFEHTLQFLKDVKLDRSN